MVAWGLLRLQQSTGIIVGTCRYLYSLSDCPTKEEDKSIPATPV